MSQDFLFQCTLSPRYTDLDTWRHVNNTRLYHFHQEARLRAHLELFGPDAWFSDQVRLRPLRSVTNYQQVTWYGSDVQAEVSVLSCDAEQYRVRSELFQNGQRVGVQDCVMGALAQGQWVELPDYIRTGLLPAVSGEVAALPDDSFRQQLAHAHNFAVRQQVTPRYADLDADSQRSEAALARYMEQARFGAIRSLDLQGLGVLVASTDICFDNYQPGWHAVELAAGINRIGNSSFCFTGCALHKDQVQAAANSVMVLIDPANNRPIALPPAVREQLEALRV